MPHKAANVRDNEMCVWVSEWEREMYTFRCQWGTIIIVIPKHIIHLHIKWLSSCCWILRWKLKSSISHNLFYCSSVSIRAIIRMLFKWPLRILLITSYLFIFNFFKLTFFLLLHGETDIESQKKERDT